MSMSKLSDKEKWLLQYLQGTDTQKLLTLGKESTTRNYGELATIHVNQLAQEITRYLNIENESVSWVQTNQKSIKCKKKSLLLF